MVIQGLSGGSSCKEKVCTFSAPVPLYIEATPSSNNTYKLIDNPRKRIYYHFGKSRSRTAKINCTQKNTISSMLFACIFLRIHVYSYLLWHDSYEARGCCPLWQVFRGANVKLGNWRQVTVPNKEVYEKVETTCESSYDTHGEVYSHRLSY